MTFIAGLAVGIVLSWISYKLIFRFAKKKIRSDDRIRKELFSTMSQKSLLQVKRQLDAELEERRQV